MSAVPFPREAGFDSTLALLSEGYAFIGNRCRRHRSDVFETRLMLRRAVCALGEDAAAMFYHPGRFTRKMALPPTALLLLEDRGSVQLRDGAAHRLRKRLFLSLLQPDGVAQLVDIAESHWHARIERWAALPHITLHLEMERVLCGAACEWAGVPLTEAAVAQHAEEFAAMIDGAGAVGPRNLRGLRLRSRTEDWARDMAGVR